MRASWMIVAGLAAGCAHSRAHDQETARAAKLERTCMPSLEGRPKGPVGCVRGMVHDAKTGRTVSGAMISAYLPGHDDAFTALSGESGEYSMLVPAGLYTLGVFTTEGELVQRLVEVRTNEATSIMVKLPRGRSQTGLLRQPGAG